jgi:hypothetical protein
VLDNDLPEWIGNKIRVFIAGRATFDAIGRSGQGHNADWCAGWTAHLIASAVPQPPQGEVK